MKLTKPQIKLHEQCLEILKQESLTEDEKEFVLENYFPAYDVNIGKSGVFFTPTELAKDFRLEVDGSNVIDLCSGIGMLSFYCLGHHSVKNITCVEQNPTFVEIGKKILPEANWICGDALDLDFLKTLGKFDVAISNPPFGKIMGRRNEYEYKGANFDLKVVEMASKIAKVGAFILPGGSVPFTLNDYYRTKQSSAYEKFNKETGIVLEPNCGIDCSIYTKCWKGATVQVEIAIADFTEVNDEPTPLPNPKTEQITLF